MSALENVIGNVGGGLSPVPAIPEHQQIPTTCTRLQLMLVTLDKQIKAILLLHWSFFELLFESNQVSCQLFVAEDAHCHGPMQIWSQWELFHCQPFFWAWLNQSQLPAHCWVAQWHGPIQWMWSQWGHFTVSYSLSLALWGWFILATARNTWLAKERYR